MKHILYILLFLSWWILSILPLSVLYLISDLLYPIVYYIIRYRRKIVHNNLLLVFPDKSDEERLAIEKKYYAFFCDYVMETMKLLTISRKQLMRRMTFEGVDTMINDMRRNNKNFSFVFLGHYGNWEWVASLPYWASENDKDITFGQIYHPLRNPAMDKLFLYLRGRFNGENIPMKQTLRRIVEHKQKNEKLIIGFISDQLPKWNSIHHFSPFLGQDSAVFTGTEQIGKQVDAAFYYGEITRPKRGYYHCKFIKMEGCGKSTPNFEITDKYMNLLEQMIRQTPELWLWSHNRWKRTKEEWIKRNGNKEP